jgi:hypothetical protein
MYQQELQLARESVRFGAQGLAAWALLGAFLCTTCSSCLLPELQSVWLSCVMSTVIHDYVCSCLLACSIVVAYCCHCAQVERITKVGMERDGIHASEKEHVHAAMARIRMVRLSLPLFIIFVMHLPPPSSGH